MSIAIPSFQDMIMNNRLTAQTNDVITLLQVARSSAVRYRGPVTVAPPPAGGVCTPGTNGTNWNQGLCMIADTNSSGAIDSADTTIRVLPALPTGSTLKAFAGGTVKNDFSFDSMGAMSGARAGFLLCYGSQAKRTLSVEPSGRVSSCKIGSGSCVAPTTPTCP
jgi:type IV fimbrial biogenesis protein FimT